jgi:hypothetical protein
MATHDRISPTAPKPSLWERYRQMWQENFARRQSFSSSVAAIFREAIKDVRGTLMESYFGRPEHPGEPGTPFNPTPQIVTAEMGYSNMLDHVARRGPEKSDELSK